MANKGRWVLYYETPDGRMTEEQSFDTNPLTIIEDGADGVLKDKNRDAAKAIVAKSKKVKNGKAKSKK